MGYFKKGFVTAMGACLGITVFQTLDKCAGKILEKKSKADDEKEEVVSESDSEETE